jgi:RNA polymerase sigma-70 factor (ECF subfamily)
MTSPSEQPVKRSRSRKGAPTVSPKEVAALDADNARALSELIPRIAKQDQAALASLYDATVSRVYAVALRIVRLPEWAEEVTSDVYLQAWREARRYDAARGKVLAWLLIMARTRALDHLRRQDEALSHPDPALLVAEPSADADDALSLLQMTRDHHRLHEALTILSPQQRQLLALAFFRGLSHAEIVTHTALPLGSVKTHIRRALLVLREALGDPSDETERAQ